MSKHQLHLLPALSFGTTRTGTLKCAIGRRGRVGIKGDATFSGLELQALVSQLTWFLSQMAQAPSTAPHAFASATTTPDPLRGAQLPLPLTSEGAPNAEDSAHGNGRSAISR